MLLTLNQDEKMLADMAKKFVSQRAEVGRIRSFRDDPDSGGHDPALWREMAELGWLGLQLPEEVGGLGMSFFDLCTVLEQVGRNLMPEPFVATVLLGAPLVAALGTDAQKQEILPEVIAGERILALAHQEAKSRYDLNHVATTAQRTDEGFVLSGRKTLVMSGSEAHELIVSARTAGAVRDEEGISLFRVDPGSPGLTRSRQVLVDGRSACSLELRDVTVSKDALLGSAHSAASSLGDVIDRANIGLAAMMLGASTSAFEQTLAYLKERVQFDVPIGSFQALQHRAARMFMEIELSRSSVLAAARTVDESPENTAELASLVKACMSDTFIHVTNEAVQMFGGVGVTEEYDIGLYMKRARVDSSLLGDADWHRDRWAKLRGY
jgi:acyl-CoA dehydrogenase